MLFLIGLLVCVTSYSALIVLLMLRLSNSTTSRVKRHTLASGSIRWTHHLDEPTQTDRAIDLNVA